MSGSFIGDEKKKHTKLSPLPVGSEKLFFFIGSPIKQKGIILKKCCRCWYPARVLALAWLFGVLLLFGGNREKRFEKNEGLSMKVF